MPTFRDANGREWSFQITCSDLEPLRERAEFDVAALVEDTGRALQRLQHDYALVARAVWVLCEEQAEARGISEEHFRRGLFGDALGAAQKALMEACAHFFPDPAMRRVFELAIAEIHGKHAERIAKAEAAFQEAVRSTS
jgi:hypothetical protein